MTWISIIGLTDRNPTPAFPFLLRHTVAPSTFFSCPLTPFRCAAGLDKFSESSSLAALVSLRLRLPVPFWTSFPSFCSDPFCSSSPSGGSPSPTISILISRCPWWLTWWPLWPRMWPTGRVTECRLPPCLPSTGTWRVMDRRLKLKKKVWMRNSCLQLTEIQE